MSEPSARDIADLLRDNAETIGRTIFPHAALAGGFLCIGSLQGEAGDSLKIQTLGPKRGTWADYATSDSDPKGKGDMLKLLQLTIGNGSLAAAVTAAKQLLGLDSMDPRALDRMRERSAKAQARAERDAAGEAERKRRNAEGLWQSAAPLSASSPAVRYLEGRGIDFAVLAKLPGSLRFKDKVIHGEHSEQRGERVWLPAMVSKFTALDGGHAGTHLTFLEYALGGWRKLPDLAVERTDPETGEVTRRPVKVAKKIHSPLYWGAHIPLWKGGERCPLKDVRPGTPVYVSEGIEDGLSYAMADRGARVVAAGTGGNVGQLLLPPQAGDLVILAQNDLKPEPIAKLEACVAEQQRRAKEQGSPRKVRLKYPPQGIKDWNDWLRAGEGETP